MSLSASLARSDDEIKAEVSMNRNDKQLSGKLIITGTELKNHGLAMRIISPSIKVRGRYDLTVSANGFKVKSSYNGQELTIDSAIRVSPKFETKVTVKTPFQCLRTAKLELSSTIQSNEIIINAEIEKNGNAMNAEFSGSHDEMRAVSIKTSVSGYLLERPVEIAINGRRNPRTTALNLRLTTPFGKIRNGQINLNVQGGLNNLAATITGIYNKHRLTVNTRIRGTTEAFVGLTSTNPSLNGLSASITKPGSDEITGEITYGPYKKIQASIKGSLPSFSRSSKGDITITLKTPFDAIRDLSIRSKHHHEDLSLVNSHMIVSLNGEKVCDTTFILRKSSDDYEVSLNMASPRQINVNLVQNTDAKNTVANFAVKLDSHRVLSLTVTEKDESTYYRTKKEKNIELRLPHRIMRVGASIDSSRYQKIFTGEINWDAAKNRKIAYRVKVNDRSRSYRRNYVGDLEIFTPIRTFKADYSHSDDKKKYHTEVTMMWDAARDSERRLTVKTDYEDDGTNRKVQVSLRHPRMEKDLIVRVHTIRNQKMTYSGRTEVEYSNDPSEKLVIAGSLGSSSNNYTVNMRLSHPRSHININMDSHIADTDTKMSAGMNVNYLAAVRRTEENIYLRTEIDKIKKSMNLRFYSPIQNFNLKGGIKRNDNGFGLNMFNDFGNNKLAGANIDVVTSESPSIDFSILYDAEDPTKQFHISAKYLENKKLTVESYRSDGNKRVTEGLFAIHLNNSHLMHTRIHWRPAMINEYMKLGSEFYNTFTNKLQESETQIKNNVAEEINTRKEMFSRTLPNIEPAVEYLRSEIKSINADVKTVTDELKEMYARNEFFAKDFAETVQSFREKIVRFTHRFVRSVQLQVAILNRKIDILTQDIIDVIADLVLRFRPQWQRYAYSAIRSYLVTAQVVRHRYQEALEYGNDVTSKLSEVLEDNFGFITSRIVPVMEKLISFQKEMRKRLRSQKEVTVLDVIVDFTKEMTESLQQSVDDSITYISQNMASKMNEIILEAFDHMNEKLAGPIKEELKVRGGRLLRIARKIYENVREEQHITNILDLVMSEMVNFAKAEFDEFARSYRVVARSGLTVYDPSNGEIQAELHLPVDLPKLHQLPYLHFNEFQNEVKRLYNKYVPEMPKSDYSFWDTYYKYKPSSEIKEWVPPFKGQASVMHGKHFKTFDGSYFDFSGDCSYILSRDFRDAAYTIFINYINGEKASLTINSNGKQFKVFNDGKVAVDGQQTELPYTFANTTVSRTFDAVIVKNTEGISVTCDLKTDICNIEISGWYYGRTGGLLGTYDNEPNNDFVTPAKKLVTDVQEFARSWQLLGGECRPRHLANHVQSTKVRADCQAMFADNESPLRPCFKIVDPSYYNKVCQSDSKPTCDVMKWYVNQCRQQGVQLSTPKMCSTCQEGETNEIESQKSSDVVFVVEERTCNKPTSRKLQSLLRQIEYSLSAKGNTNNRYGIVAYGGDGVHHEAHIHTAENQLFSGSRRVSRSLSSLEFENNGKQGDLTEAIKFAAKYPYRNGVIRLMVVLPCGDDTVSASIESVLLDRAIIMHVAVPHDFEMMTATPKTQYIFGVDKNTAYTVRDVRSHELRGDKDFFRQIVLPKSTLVQTAFNTIGSAFNVNKMTDGRIGYQKHFIDVFARRVAKTPIASSCQICTCINGESVCRPCDIPVPTSQPMVQPLSTPPNFKIGYEV